MYVTSSKSRYPPSFTTVYAIPTSNLSKDPYHKVWVGLAHVLLSKLGWKCVLRSPAELVCVEKEDWHQAKQCLLGQLFCGGDSTTSGGDTRSFSLAGNAQGPLGQRKPKVAALFALFEKAQNSQDRGKRSLWMVRI